MRCGQSRQAMANPRTGCPSCRPVHPYARPSPGRSREMRSSPGRAGLFGLATVSAPLLACRSSENRDGASAAGILAPSQFAIGSHPLGGSCCSPCLPARVFAWVPAPLPGGPLACGCIRANPRSACSLERCQWRNKGTFCSPVQQLAVGETGAAESWLVSTTSVARMRTTPILAWKPQRRTQRTTTPFELRHWVTDRTTHQACQPLSAEQHHGNASPPGRNPSPCSWSGCRSPCRPSQGAMSRWWGMRLTRCQARWGPSRTLSTTLSTLPGPPQGASLPEPNTCGANTECPSLGPRAICLYAPVLYPALLHRLAPGACGRLLRAAAPPASSVCLPSGPTCLSLGWDGMSEGHMANRPPARLRCAEPARPRRRMTASHSRFSIPGLRGLVVGTRTDVGPVRMSFVLRFCSVRHGSTSTHSFRLLIDSEQLANLPFEIPRASLS